MDNLTLVLILVLVVLAYFIYTHHEESLDNVSGSKCVHFDLDNIQTNEINSDDKESKDIESQYFNQLERNKSWNERQMWLNSMELEKKRQTTHECLL
jgi:hypothetical protein